MTEPTQSVIGKQVPVEPAAVPRLTGRWLRLARAAWVVVALAALIILLTSLPGYLQTFGGQLSHIRESQSAGVIILAVLSGMASLAAAVLSLTLATIFFQRRFTDPVAAALSFYLLGYAVVMAGPLETWSTYWLGSTSLAMLLQGLLIPVPSVALFALFPSGRFVPRWTRWLLPLTLPYCISLFFLPSFDEASASEQSPLVLAIMGLWIIGLFGAGIYAQVIRYRRVSSPSERQQTKWVLYGFTLWLGYILVSTIPYFYLTSLPPMLPHPGGGRQAYWAGSWP